jgi:hypothetical protein
VAETIESPIREGSVPVLEEATGIAADSPDRRWLA